MREFNPRTRVDDAEDELDVVVHTASTERDAEGLELLAGVRAGFGKRVTCLCLDRESLKPAHIDCGLVVVLDYVVRSCGCSRSEQVILERSHLQHAVLDEARRLGRAIAVGIGARYPERRERRVHDDPGKAGFGAEQVCRIGIEILPEGAACGQDLSQSVVGVIGEGVVDVQDPVAVDVVRIDTVIVKESDGGLGVRDGYAEWCGGGRPGDRDGEGLGALVKRVAEQRNLDGHYSRASGRDLDSAGRGGVVRARRGGSIGGLEADGDWFAVVPGTQEGHRGRRRVLVHRDVRDGDRNRIRIGRGLEERDGAELGVVGGRGRADGEQAIGSDGHRNLHVIGPIHADHLDQVEIVDHLHAIDAHVEDACADAVPVRTLGRIAAEGIGEFQPQHVVARLEAAALEGERRQCPTPAPTLGHINRIVGILDPVAGVVTVGRRRPVRRDVRGADPIADHIRLIGDAAQVGDRRTAGVDGKHEIALGQNDRAVILGHRSGCRPGSDQEGVGPVRATDQRHVDGFVEIVGGVIGDRHEKHTCTSREGDILGRRLAIPLVADGDRPVEAVRGGEGEGKLGEAGIAGLHHGGGVGDRQGDIGQGSLRYDEVEGGG